jgi:hypothetical protein
MHTAVAGIIYDYNYTGSVVAALRYRQLIELCVQF